MQCGIMTWIFAVMVVVAENITTNSDPLTSCILGQTPVADGEVAMHLPEKCVSLICQKGEIVVKMTGEPGDTGCCLAQDEMSPPLHTSPHCFPVTCRNGSWVPENFIDPCCRHCEIYGYSHFTTFDGQRFDWHGFCNYTLLILAAREDRDAGGIFAEMTRVGSCATVCDRVTLRGDSHTIINMTHDADGNVSDQIHVNADSMIVPPNGTRFVTSSAGKHGVLVFWQNDCLIFLTFNLLTVRYCPIHMDIWVPHKLNGFVDGLCGHFNYDAVDDFASPTSEILPYEAYPVYYADEQWRSPDQYLASCNESTTTSICNGTIGNKCMISASDLQDYERACGSFLTELFPEQPWIVEYYQSPCVADLCLAFQGDMNFSLPLLASVTKVLSNYKNIATGRYGDTKITPALLDVDMCLPIENSTTVPVNEETVPVNEETVLTTSENFTTVPVNEETVPVNEETVTTTSGNSTTVPVNEETVPTTSEPN